MEPCGARATTRGRPRRSEARRRGRTVAACAIGLVVLIIVGMDGADERRPLGVTVLAVFSVVAAIISFTSALSLLWPGGPLEPMWRINPRAREGFAAMGPWAPLMLAGVCVGSALSAVGLWRGRRWGYRLAIAGLVVNLVGDATNALVRHDPRSAVGIPIVGGLIAYLLTDSVRRFFRRTSR